MVHHLFTLMLGGKLHLAPIENPHRILDVGTGTGIWALDIAEQYPEAEVLGTDLSPIQPGWYVHTILYHRGLHEMTRVQGVPKCTIPSR
jgi:cyclopropane fatty-acyl-phospholipid synthase-like methyltransferase